MFRCDVCNTVVPAGTPQVKVIVDTREKTYDITPQLSEKEKRKARRRGINVDPGRQFAQGWEIVKEVNACPTCAAKPELREALERQLAARASRGVVVDDEAEAVPVAEV